MTSADQQPPRLDQQQVGGDHYSKLRITPWEALQAWLTPEEFRGYLKGEAIVYIAREASKAGPVDIGKARHVLQKLEEVYPAGTSLERARAAVQELMGEYPPVTPCSTCAAKGCQHTDACTVLPPSPATGQTPGGRG